MNLDHQNSRATLGVIADAASSVVPTRADVVKEVSKRVPLNNLGLPEGIHRSDLLHPHSGIVKKTIPQEDLLRLPNGVDLSQGLLTDDGPLLILDEKAARAAYIPLDYREGFPTVPTTGQPFWGQLEFEPVECHRAFEEYIKQGTSEGARRLFALACDPKIHQICGLLNQATPRLTGPINGHQYHPSEEEQLEANKVASQQANRQLQEWFTIYYWGPRARAHDLFYLEGIRQSQGMQALHLQNDHFKDSQRLYHQVMDFIEGSNPDHQTDDGKPRFWTEMTPRVLVDFLKVLSSMQRVSLGLPASGPADASSPNSAVGILNQLIRGQSSSYEGSGGGGGGGRRSGRPKIDYGDEGGNPSQGLLSPPSPNGHGHGHGSGPSMSGGPSSSSSTSDDDRARRISMIMNSAKARRDANRPSPPPDESTESTESTDD